MLFSIHSDILKVIVNLFSLEDLLPLRMVNNPMKNFLEKNIKTLRVTGQAVVTNIKVLFPSLKIITGEVLILSERFFDFRDISFEDITLNIARRKISQTFEEKDLRIKSCLLGNGIRDSERSSRWRSADTPQKARLRFEKFLHRFICRCLLTGFSSSSNKTMLKLESESMYLNNDVPFFYSLVSIENKRLFIQKYFVEELLEHENVTDDMSKQVFITLGRCARGIDLPTFERENQASPGYTLKLMSSLTSFLQRIPEIKNLHLPNYLNLNECFSIGSTPELMKRFKDEEIICAYPAQKEFVMKSRKSSLSL